MMWHLRSGQTLRSRRFDDEFVLYNDLSGDTHLLGGAAMHLLALLQQQPRAQEALFSALAAALECPRADGFDDQAAAVLAQLHALALIRSA